MKVNTRRILTLALAFGLALAGISAGGFWMHWRHDTSCESATTATTRPDDFAKSVILRDLETLKEKIERLEKGRSGLEVSSAKTTGELESFRLQLALIASRIDQIARGDFESPEKKATYKEASDLELTPEEEIKRADAQIQRQVALFEETMQREGTDPEWSSEAEFLLDKVYRSDKMNGVELVGVQCGTTLCRLELYLDGSVSPEEVYSNVTHFSPWPTQGFFQIDDGETGQSLIYFTREGYSLPEASI